MSPRNAALVLDAAAGMSYENLAVKYSLSPQRAGQIVIKVRGDLRMTTATKEHLGCVLARHLARVRGWSDTNGTPEEFYWDELVLNRSREQGFGGW